MSQTVLDREASVIVIGGGQSAGCAALGMRAAGFAGRIVLLAAEEHLPYERPPLSKASLTAQDPMLPVLFSRERYDAAGVEIRLSSPVASIERRERHVLLADGSLLDYARLLIATGGEARRLSIPGAQHIHYLRSYRDAMALRGMLRAGGRILCIGAGVIGLEIASTARALGCAVTVAEVGSSVMGRCLAPAEADYAAGLHRAAGIDLRLSTGVIAVEADTLGAACQVFLTDGTAMLVDYVVAGVGMTRNTALAEASGIAVDNGILVNEFGCTDSPDIYAAGDVAAFWHPRLLKRMRLESWHHAQDHGATVGNAIVSSDAPAYDPVPRFWTDQQGINFQVAGDPAAAHIGILRGEPSSTRFTVVHLDSENRMIGVTTANNARDMRPAIALIRSRARLDPVLLARADVPLHKIPASHATD